MGTPRFTPEFKEEAVKQVTDRGYSVSDVAARIGVSAHSLYSSVAQWRVVTHLPCACRTRQKSG